jgi:TPR repeat protein
MEVLTMANRLSLTRWAARWHQLMRFGLSMALVSAAGFAFAQADAQRYAQAQQMLQSGQHAAAAQAFRQLATDGDAASQFQLSLLYRMGRGVPADPRASLQWLRRAAAGSYPAALSNLGGEYAKGQAVAQDKVRALALFYLAEAGGMNEARTNAQVVARMLTPEQLTQGRDLALRCTREGPQPCL